MPTEAIHTPFMSDRYLSIENARYIFNNMKKMCIRDRRGSIPADATYTVAGVGRYEFPLAALAIIDGGHVRVGFEDNVYICTYLS